MFKNVYKLPENYFSLIKECKYLNYYYSEEERNNYLNTWQSKLTTHFVPYTVEEYKFYVTLYLENQYINDIQTEHYIDDGCYCNLCKTKRKDMFFKAKKGEKITEKITHHDLVYATNQNRNARLIKLLKNTIEKKTTNMKFNPKQFKIKIQHS